MGPDGGLSGLLSGFGYLHTSFINVISIQGEGVESRGRVVWHGFTNRGDKEK